MNQIVLDIDEEVLRQANGIFEDVGIDFSTATRMFLKKVIKERSISFLINAKPVDNSPSLDEPKSNIGAYSYAAGNYPSLLREDNKITKSIAKRLICNNNYTLYPGVTFASKNTSSYNYWANPEFALLDNNWSLILNDWMNNTIYLFNIPAKSISKSELVPRRDRPWLIDLQIMYDDPTFTDNRSGYSFLKFKAAEINY